MRLMKLLGPMLAVSVLLPACTGHDDGRETPVRPDVETAPPEPPPTVDPAKAVQVAVASVQLQDDCPPRRSTMTQPEPMGDEEPGMQQKGAPSFAPSCVQSMVQLSIESEADEALRFAVREVRLKHAENDAVLGTMTSREPQVWSDSKYEAWGENIDAGASLKVGYALGDPNWNAVGKALGGSTWGPLYYLEIDVEIDGKVRTVVSPKVPRDEPENIVT